ncbi:DNA methyltransferase [Donghicola mangrovi]|uniref:site-specific DNA-methyltransferase (adenine-specific) n=1 Tax=Donghicola mangrovi TaxID=2729614 RepID=A0A850QBJ1_9RHOB|nr:DNA methyltransferase [Donghicola mangrovi]NVO25722.1 helix-turn-helix domain-containing protein [Donghicola mangrovi]
MQENYSNTNKIVSARLKLNLTVKELAEKLGTSFYAVSRLERGDVEPDGDFLRKLAQLTGEAVGDNPESGAEEKITKFESSGLKRRRQVTLPLFQHNDCLFMDEPRASLMSGLSEGGFVDDGESALSDILSRRSNAARTAETPLESEISAGKNTYTYDAHTYHTKVPPQGIASVIAKYLPDGGLVLDPFGGSGMTAVASNYIGCDAIINELSPAACFISHNFLQKVDVDEFGSYVRSILDSLQGLREQLYGTTCRECGAHAEIQFTVWSYELECNHCGREFILWDHCRKYGKTIREHKLLKKFPCPHCGEEVNKSYLVRRESYPVFLGYKCCSKKIVERPLLPEDHAKIAKACDLLEVYKSDFPDFSLPDGVNLNQPKRHGLDSVAKFYTDRNLVACAALWREIRRIEDPNMASALAFAFTSLYQRVTKLSEYRFWGGSGNTANFNVPQISNEANVFVTFERKSRSISDHFATTGEKYSGRSLVRNGSATDLKFLPDECVDMIFTDPPFGGNINYSEMNTLWEAWLGAFTDSTNEAIMNKSQGKGVEEYRALMSDSLKEAHRVLRTGHWMVLVFMNSSEKVWTALRSAIVDAGFSIEKISIFDKQHGTFKQFVSENAAGADLMIHCKKSTKTVLPVGGAEKSELPVCDFVETQKGKVPIMPFLHVNRNSEVDYRTLYSRYISAALREQRRFLDFFEFRKLAKNSLESDK